SGDPHREIGDLDLLGGADMIYAEVLPACPDNHDAPDQIADVTEAARFLPAALDWKRDRFGRAAFHRSLQTKRKLRDHVLGSHVRSVDVVRPKDQHPIEVLAAVIEGHDLTDDFSGSVGIAGILRVGND